MGKQSTVYVDGCVYRSICMWSYQHRLSVSLCAIKSNTSRSSITNAETVVILNGSDASDQWYNMNCEAARYLSWRPKGRFEWTSQTYLGYGPSDGLVYGEQCTDVHLLYRLRNNFAAKTSIDRVCSYYVTVYTSPCSHPMQVADLEWSLHLPFWQHLQGLWGQI